VSRAEVAGPEEEAEFGPPGGGVEGLGVGVGGELAAGGGGTVTCGEGMLVRWFLKAHCSLVCFLDFYFLKSVFFFGISSEQFFEPQVGNFIKT